MATWRSKKIKGEEDMLDDYVDVQCYWEYQTTADIFSYHEIFDEEYDRLNVHKGGDSTKIHLSDRAAKRLFHALANWMKNYHSKEEAMAAINDNIFDKGSDNEK